MNDMGELKYKQPWYDTMIFTDEQKISAKISDKVVNFSSVHEKAMLFCQWVL